MNDVGCQRAVKQLIEGYSSVLTSGFTHQGQVRSIKDIVLSPMTAPRDFYFVYIGITNATTQSFGGNPGNEGKPHRAGKYQCEVHIVDVAIPQGSDVEPYELMHVDFRELGNRFEAMLTGSYHAGLGTYASYFESLPICLEDTQTDSKFTLERGRGPDRQVVKENLDHTWYDPDNDTYTPLFYSIIRFNLIEGWTV
ncbi:MAG: hypothetical protein GWN77_06545 [Gammaproteobacteria bacterium]|nr:hypothetical protein [Gammaproteobacteria bacterium]